jgi:glyoxylase-like metal-dependent hydrolase (beta-lactamase superfamily II)
LLLGQYEVTAFFSNCFVLGCEDTREAIVIDTGEFSTEVAGCIEKNKLDVKYIILTHSHVDHAADVGRFKEATGGEIVVHADEEQLYANISTQARMFGLEVPEPPPADKLVNHGDELTFGDGIKLEIIHCPGHSPGGMAILCGDIVFVGDTLFAGSIGRTDLPGGDHRTLIDSIKTRLLTLDDSIQVFPGHGGSTTIGNERQFNPFLV